MLFAAGCATSISRRMAWPSFVRTMPPIGSSSILSIAFGPRHDRIISATLYMVSSDLGVLCEGPCLRLRRGNVRDLSLPTNLPFTALRINDHHRRLHRGGGKEACCLSFCGSTVARTIKFEAGDSGAWSLERTNKLQCYNICSGG